MKHRKQISELQNACAYCGSKVNPNDPAYCCDASFHGYEYSGKRGIFVWLIPKTPDKPILAFVTPLESPAKEAGIDLIIPCCSLGCRSGAAEALQLGFDVHEITAHQLVGSGKPKPPKSSAN